MKLGRIGAVGSDYWESDGNPCRSRRGDTVGPSPCEKFNCVRAAVCNAEHTACAAFYIYTETDKAEAPHRYTPTREIYDKVYSGGRVSRRLLGTST